MWVGAHEGDGVPDGGSVTGGGLAKPGTQHGSPQVDSARDGVGSVGWGFVIVASC